jgi:hypothetical protein
LWRYGAISRKAKEAIGVEKKYHSGGVQSKEIIKKTAFPFCESGKKRRTGVADRVSIGISKG